MLRPSTVVLAALVAVTTPAAAQSSERLVRVILGAGIAGQRDDEHDLGSPGVSASAGVELRLAPRLAVRLEAQRFQYPGQATVIDDAGPGETPLHPAEGVNVGLASVVWRADGAFHAFVGGGAMHSDVRRVGSVRSGALGAGVGLTVRDRYALEAQWLHAMRALSRTRAVLGLRAVVWL